MAAVSILSELTAIVGKCLASAPFPVIVITMYYRDHNPPHFHATYGEHRAQIVIATLEPLFGGLPSLRLSRWYDRATCTNSRSRAAP
jgi:hypothetical protein